MSSARSVVGERTWFDRFADEATGVISNAPFFLGCVGFVAVWLVTGPFLHFSHHWVDALHLPALIVTLLMVALLENEQRRSDQATQRKLNAITAALAEFMQRADMDPRHAEELRAAVGLEKRESTHMTPERADRIRQTRARKEERRKPPGTVGGDA